MARKPDEALTEAEEILQAEEAEAQAKAAEAAGLAPSQPAPVDPKAAKSRLPEIPIAERAVVTCQEDLDRVLREHKRWVEAVLDPNVEVASGRANLEGLDLRGYALAGANLSGANLARCILTSVDLTRANLTVANLQGAQLQDANLSGAKLTRAKLEGADLRGADLTGANLNGVDFSKAILKSEAKEPAKDGAKERQGASYAGPLTPEDKADAALATGSEASTEEPQRAAATAADGDVEPETQEAAPDAPAESPQASHDGDDEQRPLDP